MDVLPVGRTILQSIDVGEREEHRRDQRARTAHAGRHRQRIPEGEVDAGQRRIEVPRQASRHRHRIVGPIADRDGRGPPRRRNSMARSIDRVDDANDRIATARVRPRRHRAPRRTSTSRRPRSRCACRAPRSGRARTATARRRRAQRGPSTRRAQPRARPRTARRSSGSCLPAPGCRRNRCSQHDLAPTQSRPERGDVAAIRQIENGLVEANTRTRHARVHQRLHRQRQLQFAAR